MAKPTTNKPTTNAPEFTVGELAGALKRTIEESFGFVRLRGEISNYRGPHSSGHAYFCLKDKAARIDAVIWKGTLARLKVKPEEGLEVIASGKVTTYPGKSSYQIVVENLEPADSARSWRSSKNAAASSPPRASSTKRASRSFRFCRR